MCCRVGRFLFEGLLEIVVEQSVGAIVLVGLWKWVNINPNLLRSFASCSIGKSRIQLLGELLAGQCDVVLVDRDDLPH